MKKLLLLLLEDSAIREALISWPETHLGGIVAHYGYREPEARIREAMELTKPDVVCYSATLGPHQPRKETLAWLKSQCRSVLVGWDAGCPNWYEQMREYKRDGVFDLTIAADGGTYPEITDLCFPEPKNPDHWQSPPNVTQERDVELGFMGGIGDTGMRKPLFEKLKDVVTIRPRTQYLPPYSEYVNFVKRCWSQINVAETGGGGVHVKGRVIESALAGCLLFESAGSTASKWFTPGEEYVEYKTTEDVRSVLRRPDFHDVCRVMGGRLREKVKRYHPRHFWKAVTGE